MHPAAGTARVWQRDRDGSAAHMFDRVLSADDLIERLRTEEPIDRQAPDGDDERRADDAQLVLEPAGALRPLGGRRDPVAAAGGMRARIAARDRRDVEQVACGRL